ncbi:uncharacterized protein LOC129303876 [Prosopis cineraria]|uniref:uncharacterized protein LOC129303876 n=1 Tax=Prosopis cineraria TaxID=364024 RepID=UPI00240E9E22|nr:uncharacterized protein LOC129303876 [Prosopis cineraria]
MSPLPSVNQAYSFISQDEAQRLISSTPSNSSHDNAVMTTQGGRNGRGRGRGWNANPDECSYCHRRGHKRGQCFQLVGFSLNFEPCVKEQESQINQTYAHTPDQSSFGNTIAVTPNLTPQQYEQLLQMLKKDSNSNDSAVGAIGTPSGHLDWNDQGDW